MRQTVGFNGGNNPKLRDKDSTQFTVKDNSWTTKASAGGLTDKLVDTLGKSPSKFSNFSLKEMVTTSLDVTSGNCTFSSKSCNSFPL
ncbi:hypothetical protein AMECASPLE_011657 [Ameca splendens]|uniref:Uncharacterized protein n=1 Tax=Ameca splendens TaxID=208324 RepID=A0ABV0ZAZ0_9TELE